MDQFHTFLTIMWTIITEVFPPVVTWQMYAYDMVIYPHAKNKRQAAEERSASTVNISNWLTNLCLHLNVNKTVYMFFSKPGC